MLDVGVKGILRMKFDYSLDSKAFFMAVAFISESLKGPAMQNFPRGYAPRTLTLSPLTWPSPTTRLHHWLNDNSQSFSSTNFDTPRCPSACPAPQHHEASGASV